MASFNGNFSAVIKGNKRIMTIIVLFFDIYESSSQHAAEFIKGIVGLIMWQQQCFIWRSMAEEISDSGNITI